MKKLIFAFAAALVLGLTARLAFFTVEEGRSVLVLRWDQSQVKEVMSSGLHVKLPDPIERTEVVDCRGRLMRVPAPDPGTESRLPTLGYDVIWRVTGPALWWKSFSGSSDQTVRELSSSVQEASGRILAKLSDPELIQRAAGLAAEEVAVAVAERFRERGVTVESVRPAEVRMNSTSQKAAADATAKTLGGQIKASGKFAEEGAAAVRAAADMKAVQTLDSALSQARAIQHAADLQADAEYEKIEKVSGERGFAAALKKAREESVKSGKAVPAPEFSGSRNAEGAP